MCMGIKRQQKQQKKFFNLNLAVPIYLVHKSSNFEFITVLLSSTRKNI